MKLDNNPLISFVIPCYNDKKYIEECVNSALNQTYKNIEIIIVDDGSDEETKLVLQKIEPKISKLITQKNQGQSCARNIGIKNAKGTYILNLDSDDFFEPTFCEKAISNFKSDTTCKIVTSFTNIIYEQTYKKEKYIPQGGNISKMMYSNTAMGSCMFLKENWKNVGGYDESMKSGFEDWEFYIRVLKSGGVVKVIPEYLFNYRRKLQSTTVKANKIKYNLLQYIFVKHKELYVNNFDGFLDFFLNKIKKEEEEKIKKEEKIDFVIGKKILKPFRFLKKLFK